MAKEAQKAEMMPNQALQRTPWPRVARPGFHRLLRPLGAAERRR